MQRLVSLKYAASVQTIAHAKNIKGTQITFVIMLLHGRGNEKARLPLTQPDAILPDDARTYMF